MTDKKKKILLVLLTVLMIVVIALAVTAVCLDLAREPDGSTASEETPVKTGKNIPESGQELLTYIKSENEKLKAANGGKVDNDALTELFYECDAENTVRLTREGNAYIEAKDGTKINCSDIDAAYVSRVTQKLLAQMVDVGETYKVHAADLKYGNYYTPFNELTTNHIDCSSFTQLVLYGIPYETSRYATDDDTNTAKYDFGFKLPDNMYDNTFGPKRYLANQLAHYAFDNDFAFYPNEDATNMQPGDILFFSTNQINEDYFMNITHVGICIERRADDVVYVLHGNNNDVCNYYEIRLFSDKTVAGNNNAYKDSLKLIARFPLKADKNK